jgi:O-6-methylguanine DNA methyltransferase
MTAIGKPHVQLTITTNDGQFVAAYSDKGLAGLSFPRPGSSSGAPSDTRSGSAVPPGKLNGWHELTKQALERALAGRSPGRLPPLDLGQGTEFQQAVWAALRRLSPGETASYSEIARRLERPGAARAVGAACGANPLPVLVPCHRVLAADHRLGGFSGGLDWKRALLRREGVPFR